jgi:MFS family permease
MTVVVSPGETKRVVRTFGVASFLHDMGADMVFSIWPLFLRNTLGASMTAVGLVDGIGDAFVALSQAVSGYYSDRLRKRKVFVWMGYLFGAIARFGYAYAHTWQAIIPFRILDRSGKMRGSPRDAIIADLSTNANRGRHFGFQRAMDNFGAVTGVLIALVLIRFLEYRTIFLLAAIPSILATVLVVFAVKERKPEHNGLFRGIRLTDLSSDLQLFILLNAVFNIATFSYSFLLLAANDHGIVTASVPVLYLLFNIVAAATSSPAGRLVDRIGGKTVFAVSMLAWAGVALCMPFTSNAAVIAFAFVLYGVHKGFYDPVQRSMLAELSPPEHVASVFGGFQLIMGAVSLPSSLLAGWLWDASGSSTLPFLFSFVLTALGSLLLLCIRTPKRV